MLTARGVQVKRLLLQRLQAVSEMSCVQLDGTGQEGIPGLSIESGPERPWCNRLLLDQQGQVSLRRSRTIRAVLPVARQAHFVFTKVHEPATIAVEAPWQFKRSESIGHCSAQVRFKSAVLG